MSNRKRNTDLFLILLSAATLMSGVVAYLSGAQRIAHLLWLVGPVVILSFLCVSILVALSKKKLGVDLIAVVAIGGAIALDENLTAAIIAFMLASGRMLESYAEAKARQEMTALLSKVPRTVNRYENDALVQAPLEKAQPGDRLLVRSGESVPVDGRLLSTIAVLDESTLTGESLPVSYTAGRTLQSGALNAGAAFDMLATRSAESSTFNGIIRLVQAAQAQKAPAARLADRYALLFVPFSLGIAALAWLLTNDPLRALAVVVVATPCPLILAVPVAIVCGMSRSAQAGVLMKHGGALEKLGQAKTLFFDKTGTLTAGQARLVGTVCGTSATAEQVLTLAASVDQVSSHAIAQAIVGAAHERGLILTFPEQAQETPGAGVTGWLDGRQVRVGTLLYAAPDSSMPEWLERLHQRIGDEGGAGIYVSIDGELVGALQMADEIRLETPRALRLLRAAGIEHIVMLTGDRQEIAQTIGQALGVDQVLAEQAPSEKLAAIATASAKGVTVMVGDGVNDAPALAAADVGVAMGARGAAAAAEAAQVVLLADRLDRLALALRISQKTRAIAIQSVLAGMGLSVLAMLAAAFGYLPPIAGAILQEVIDVAVILNALRVLNVERNFTKGHMATAEVAQLKSEHAALQPIIDRLGTLADQLPDMPAATVKAEIANLNSLVQQQLLPHEWRDDAQVYPLVARQIGGDDPMGAMSRTHREIYKLSRILGRAASELSEKRAVMDKSSTHELQRTLYALDAILRLHFSQEEEIYHNLV